MQIGLTVDSLSPLLTGIGRYTWELCQGMRQRADIEDLGFFRFNSWVPDPGAFLRAPLPKRLYRLAWLKRRAMRRGFRGRLIHGTNYFLPEPVEAGVLTVHDLSIHFHPETHPPERIAAFEKGFLSSMERAAHIITDSETVRAELIARMGITPDNVTAIHLGVSRQFGQFDARERGPIVRRLLGEHADDYILCVATFEPRKRIEQAILAHAQLCARGPQPALVLVGARGWSNNSLHALIEQQVARGALIMLGQIAEAELPCLYAGARLFLYPSIYEGFGLPPIEAMASGVPTIVSNRSCLPEVTQGAAMLVDPDDLDGFAEAIRCGLEDDNWRCEAIDRGLRVAAGYTWEKCVENTVEVYRKVWAQRA